MSHIVRAGCEAKRLTTVECERLAEVDKDIRAKIVTPAKEVDWAKLEVLIRAAANLAAKGAI